MRAVQAVLVKPVFRLQRWTQLLVSQRRACSSSPGAVQTPPRPLEGTIVVELGQAIAAPYCCSRLADAGARVIKLERKDGKGDFARGYDKFAKGVSCQFVWVNRGKESLSFDLKDADDQALLHRILSRAHVFVQNMAPGATARSGFGSEDLRKRYPHLITCDISGYGDAARSGSYWDMKAYDMLVQAESGIAYLAGKEGWPTRTGVSVADIACGMFCHAAILEALIQAKKTGVGCSIDGSLFSSLADWMTVPIFHYESDGKGPAIGHGLRHPSVQPYAAYPTKGDPILISVQNEREFATLCKGVLEKPHLLEDPRFNSNVARCEHTEALDVEIKQVFLSLDRQQLVERLREHRIAYGEVNSMPGLCKHPALTRVPVNIPGGETVGAVAPPATFDGVVRSLGPVPAYGEHGDDIRREFAAE